MTDSLIAKSSISFPDDWNKKVLSTNSTMVSGSSNLSNFTVLVTLTGDSDLSTSKVGSSGQGIRFTSDGTTLLDYEIEKYTGDANSGTLVAWVEIPTLDYDERTLLYIHYGQTSSPDMQDARGTWEGSYTHVYHLGEVGDGTANEYQNSAADTNHGQGGSGAPLGYTTPNRVTGKIGYAQDFAVGTKDSEAFIDVGTVDTDFSEALTISFWSYWDDPDGGAGNNSNEQWWSRILDFGQGPYDDNIIVAHKKNTAKWNFTVFEGGSTTPQVSIAPSSPIIPHQEWVYATFSHIYKQYSCIIH